MHMYAHKRPQWHIPAPIQPRPPPPRLALLDKVFPVPTRLPRSLTPADAPYATDNEIR